MLTSVLPSALEFPIFQNFLCTAYFLEFSSTYLRTHTQLGHPISNQFGPVEPKISITFADD